MEIRIFRVPDENGGKEKNAGFAEGKVSCSVMQNRPAKAFIKPARSFDYSERVNTAPESR